MRFASIVRLDPVTCFVVATLMMMLNGGILGLVHRDLPESLRGSAVDWRVGTLMMAGGSILLAAQEQLPTAIVLPVANGMLMFALCGYWRSLRRFYRVPDSRWLALPPVLGTMGIYWFAAQMPSLRVRVVIATVTWVTALVGCVWTLLRAGAADRAISRRVLIAILVALVLVMVGRAVYFVLSHDAMRSVLDRSSWVNLATPMLAAVLPVVGTTTFLLLLSDRIRKQWELAASTDYLTGLANRRTLGAEGEQRLARARVHGNSFAVAVIDVDHFKSINDRYGHDVGDLALKFVAARLALVCRGLDLPARQGGEEFVILFDRIDPLQAKHAGERLRATVASEPFRADGIEHAITVSIGIAALTADDRQFDDLLRRADKALYAAKNGGRNRVELSE